MYIRKGLVQGKCQNFFKYKFNNINRLDLILEMLLQLVTLQVLQKYQFRDRCNVAQTGSFSLSQDCWLFWHACLSPERVIALYSAIISLLCQALFSEENIPSDQQETKSDKSNDNLMQVLSDKLLIIADQITG